MRSLILIIPILFYPIKTHSYAFQYLMDQALWPNDPTKNKPRSSIDLPTKMTRIHVCVDDIGMSKSWQAEMVRNEILQTWGYYANIDFWSGDSPLKDETGLRSCGPTVGIKIKFVNTGRGESAIGYQLMGGVHDWTIMTLNYEKWRLATLRDPKTKKSRPWTDSEQDRLFKELIFKKQIAHEFGHALGFVHEHLMDGPIKDLNARKNLNQACYEHIMVQDKADGRLVYGTAYVGLYDRESIMHYDCKQEPRPPREDFLSPGDIAAIRKLYGVREENKNEYPLANWDALPAIIPSTDFNSRRQQLGGSSKGGSIFVGDDPANDWPEVFDDDTREPDEPIGPNGGGGTDIVSDYEKAGWHLGYGLSRTGSDYLISITVKPPPGSQYPTPCSNASVAKIKSIPVYGAGGHSGNLGFTLTTCNPTATFSIPAGWGVWLEDQASWAYRSCDNGVTAGLSALTAGLFPSGCKWVMNEWGSTQIRYTWFEDEPERTLNIKLYPRCWKVFGYEKPSPVVPNILLPINLF